MNLEAFALKKNILHPILGVGAINFVLTILMLIMSTTIFARPSGVQLEFPVLGQEASAAGRGVVIKITGENVIYIDNRVVTLTQLRNFLARGNFRRDDLMIKADRRASMGRVADILDLCRGIAGASVNVSTIL
jgi:biopolymer transport protein ExbD